MPSPGALKLGIHFPSVNFKTRRPSCRLRSGIGVGGRMLVVDDGVQGSGKPISILAVR
ncbi:UNVERIFIED_ORG: hypothetical protein QOE_0069 [Clostridioides difficile F501]